MIQKIRNGIALFVCLVMASQSTLSFAGNEEDFLTKAAERTSIQAWEELYSHDGPPLVAGAQRVFELARSSPAMKRLGLRVVALSNPIEKMAENGKLLRDQYRERLYDDFGYENVEFITRPFRRTLHLLEEAQETNRRNTYALPSENEAYQTAWESTLRQFHLPPTITIDLLEQQGQSNESAFNALIFFKREWSRRQQIEDLKIHNVPPQAEEFKARIIELTQQMRLKNFFEYVNLVLIWSNKSKDKIPYFSPRQKQVGAEVFIYGTLADLTFVNDQPPTHSLVIPSQQGLASNLISDNGNRGLGLAGKTIESPTMSLRNVRLTINKQTIVIAEKDFNDFLNFALKIRSDHPSNVDPVYWRYLYEAAPRNFLLLSLEKFLIGQYDQDLSALSERLKTKIEAFETTTKSPESLTEWLNRNGLPQKHSSALGFAELEWYGIARHPNYWLARDTSAQTRFAPIVFEYDNVTAYRQTSNAPPSRAKQKEIKKADKQWVTATRSDRESLAIRKKKFVTIPLILYGLLTAAALWPDHEPHSDNQATSRPGPNIKLSQIIGDFFKSLYKYLPDNPNGTEHIGDGEPEGQMSMDDELNPNNYAIEDTEVENRKRPVFRFTNLPTIGSVPSFHYLNLIHQSNFPEGFLKNPLAGDPNKEPPDVQKVTPVQQYLDGKTLAVAQLATSVPTRGRVAIASFSGWQLNDLEVRDESDGDNLLRGRDYQIYKLPTHGLYYIELIERYKSSKITYSAEYIPAAIPQTSKLPSVLPKSGLVSSEQNLRAINATQAATSIHELVKSNEPITIQSVEQAIYNTGLYTKNGAALQPTTNIWQRLGQFVTNGVFIYQCSGANRLLKEILNLSLNHLPSNSGPIAAQNLSGYRVSSLPEITKSSAHLHTIVTRLDHPNQYIELDGTPIQRVENLESGFNHPLRLWRLSYTMPFGPRSEDPKLTAHQEESELTLDEFKPAEKNRLLKQLLQLQLEAAVALEKYSLSILKNTSEKELAFDPGTRAITLAKLLVDFLEEKLKLDELAKKVLMVQSKMALDRALTPEQNSWLLKKLTFLKTGHKSDVDVLHALLANEPAALAHALAVADDKHYLKIDEVVMSLTALTDFIANARWVPILNSDDCSEILRSGS